jgi:hypothetical protein
MSVKTVGKVGNYNKKSVSSSWFSVESLNNKSNRKLFGHYEHIIKNLGRKCSSTIVDVVVEPIKSV